MFSAKSAIKSLTDNHGKIKALSTQKRKVLVSNPEVLNKNFAFLRYFYYGMNYSLVDEHYFK